MEAENDHARAGASCLCRRSGRAFALRRAVVDVAMGRRLLAWLESAAPGDELAGAGGDL
jgi:hypothetical protein